jgi:hypothetical protein
VQLKKSDIPVEGLYIVSFLILMSMAGMSLYLFIEGQNIASDYRISAASIIELTESIKHFIDQERAFVLETVIYFFGSQSGIENVNSYGEINYTLLSNDVEATACYNLLKAKLGSPSPELASRCAMNNPNLFVVNNSAGIWKCDNLIYSYKECREVSPLSARLCCRQAYTTSGALPAYSAMTLSSSSAGVVGMVCHQGCMSALEVNYLTKCSELDYCGSMMCRENNLEIPETYAGVPYYYKILEPIVTTSTEAGPGYICASGLTYNPEYTYTNNVSWTSKLDINQVITRLTDMASKYFYKPSPRFSNYLNNLLDSNLELTFELDFLGCDDYQCQFVWVPIVNYDTPITGRGAGGRVIMEFKTDYMSYVIVEVPLEDMALFAKELVESKTIKYYFADKLANYTYNINTVDSPAELYTLDDWNKIFGWQLGINCGGTAQPNAYINNSVFPIFDESKCGIDPYNNDCNTKCITSWMNTLIYNSTMNPMRYNRPTGYDYNLRPVMRFIETSLGATIPVYLTPATINTCGNGVCEYGEIGTGASTATRTLCTTDCISTCGNNVCNNCVYPTSLAQYSTYLACYNSNGYSDSEPCPTDCTTAGANPFAVTYNTGFTALPGEYSVFIKGSGKNNVTIQIDSQPIITFNNTGTSGFYSFSNNPKIGRCSNPGITLNTANLEEYYTGYGCCPINSYDEADNKCSAPVVANAYCNQVHNRYNGTLGGEYCSLSGGPVNYTARGVVLGETPNNYHTLKVSCGNLNGPGLTGCNVSEVEVLRVKYDNTFPLTSYTSRGVTYTYGESYQYYTNTQNCTDPMGANFIDYSSLNDIESWYSMLCLRSQGLSWGDIIEGDTGAFNRFRSVFGAGGYESKAAMVDTLL